MIFLQSTFALAVGPKLVEGDKSQNVGEATAGESGLVKRNPVYVRCTKSSAQSLLHTVFATIDYNDCTGDTEHVTTGSNWEFTAPRTGVYQVNASYLITGTGCDSLEDNALLGVKKNPAHGTESEDYRIGKMYCRTTNTVTSISRMPAGSTSIYLLKGETFAIKGYQSNTGNSHAINLSNSLTWLEIHELL